MVALSPILRSLRLFACCSILLTATSCDDVPTFQELTGADTPEGEIPTQVVPEQTAAPIPTSPEVLRPAIVKTPQQILDEFLATESRLRTHQQLEELAGLDETMRQQITVLDFKDSQLGNPATPFLTKFPALEEIDLTGTMVTNSGLQQLSQVNGLRKVTLDRMSIDGNGIEELAGQQQLRELSLADTLVSDSSFKHLLPMTELEVLRLSGIHDLQGSGFNALVKEGAFTSLRELHVTGTNFGYYGLSNIQRLPNLEVLVASNAELTDQAMAGIVACRNLKVLDLSNNLIGDNALKPLGRFRQLETLKIRDCDGITDAGLDHLRGLKNLKLLELGNVQCTPAAVRSLKEKFLTDTEIHFQGQVY